VRLREKRCRERELISTNRQVGLEGSEFLVDGGRYHDDLKKVAEFVTQLVDKSPVAMMIQRELVEKGRKVG
jgi:hypothetical protein